MEKQTIKNLTEEYLMWLQIEINYSNILNVEINVLYFSTSSWVKSK
ncbi:MAG: hypothetical protein ACD_7C00468G0004 [uncultured bacterium]|nr:MAG: hypothetical protein ACD_7C00468G0004 [uncultured bacterium]KKP67279.1 MAG: hypothetical protein UR66_C0018G0019 [Candidatus Moranbacteria bacterium GW2011_GWE1_35_17]KKP83312.1 MAG: hypothetical protein UR82_C0022G0005 [Candidatus Moranbacteria bacterium GW2011_GWF1_35_5]KKP84704.1 MAG: hypothetical protein UR83_C0014G0007 [Candidatus Moranbacteria bacterium GW2011_GWF2_35_54]